MTETSSRLRFQKANALGAGVFYLERAADREIFDALREGRSCHVLASRQVGKSSLKVRAITKLRAEGLRVASADLQGVGVKEVTVDAWCFSVARLLYDSAESNIDLSDHWDAEGRETPAARFYHALRSLAAEDPTRPLVLFLDEIDLLRALTFRGDVLQVLRALVNDAAGVPAMRGFALGLLGVALARDIAVDDDLNHTPLTGLPIELRDFTREELRPLEAGLRDLGATPEALLDAVFIWTSGHPALTQHLCVELASQGGRSEASEARVDALVRKVFLDAGRHQDQILLDIEGRFAEKSDRVQKMLSRYRAALADEALDEWNDDVQEALRIAGLVRVKGGRLATRNRIVATVFDRAWVDAKLSDRRFARAVEMWIDEGRRPSTLLRGERLREALAWARVQTELPEEDRAFFDASQEAERAEKERLVRRDRRAIWALSVLVGLLTVSSTVAVIQRQRAVHALAKTREAYDRDIQSKIRTLAADRRNVSVQEELAASYARKSDWLIVQEDFSEALQAIDGELEVRRGLARRDPSSMGWQEELCGNYRRRAWLLQGMNRSDDAISSQREALALSERYATTLPENIRWQVFHVVDQALLVAILARSGPHPEEQVEALRLAAQALTTMRHLQQTSRLTAQEQGLLQSIPNLLDFATNPLLLRGYGERERNSPASGSSQMPGNTTVSAPAPTPTPTPPH